METDTAESLFNIDAGTILARLHVVACQYIWNNFKKYSASFIQKSSSPIQIFNTGIVGMKPLTKSGILEGVTFDMSNKSKVYELGILVPKFKAEKDKYEDRIRLMMVLTHDVIRWYFIKFAGLYKIRNIGTYDLYGFLLNDNHLKAEDFKAYPDYKIPVDFKLPDQIDTDMTINNLCFKMKYELKLDTM